MISLNCVPEILSSAASKWRGTKTAEIRPSKASTSETGNKEPCLEYITRSSERAMEEFRSRKSIKILDPRMAKVGLTIELVKRGDFLGKFDR